MKNTNNRSGSVSAVRTKETNLKVFSNKDVAEMSIEMIEDLLDTEKGPVRPYRDEDLKNRAREFLSKEYQSNSFEMKIDRKKGIVWAVPISSKKETIENDFKNGKEVDSKEYCSLCKKYMKPDNSTAVSGGVTCNGIFASCGAIPCKYFERDTYKRWPGLTNSYNKALEYDWTFHATDEDDFVITALDPDGWEPIVTKTDKFLAEHICKTHNDWLKFKQKNGEKKVKKGNLRRLKNLAWRMKTFKKAFKVIEKNTYLGFDSIKIWIEQNEDDVNQWIFTKWLKNSSNYEDWTWFFNNQGNFLQNIAPNEYSEICDACQDINYFQFGKHISMNGIPEGEWDSYTFHQEYESKLFADGKDFTAALVLEKMFDFAEEYVKHTGYITAEMANKYHIDLHLVSSESLEGIQKALVTASAIAGEKLEDNTRNEILKNIINPARHICMDALKESDDKLFEKNPELKDEDVNFKKPLEQRVDNLEKMIKDIWTNICADKSPADVEGTLPKEIINKKPVIERQKCPRCKNSKDGCEFYDKGTCRGICYPTYPPQYDPCVFEK